MSVVVFERLPAGDYARDCVSLSPDYGSPAWEARPEVRAIRVAVYAALDRLDAETGIGERLRGKPALVKPNLVLVYQDIGTKAPSYPETTDPRVLDALVLWLAARASRVSIVESSGRGSPTRASFLLSGVDRLARHRGCGLIALEEEPVDRYFLPKARVLKEILVPRIFSAVVRGEACYISVPKLKTNLYTSVTLGFKNAMGVIPYNLRNRDHNRLINRKLVEMLYLFKPDLTLIDGVVGGEGECPAPVFPVDARAVIAGDHAVETDRAATRFMGFDPETIELMRAADELGFNDPCGARVLGDARPVPFRPADASLYSERVRGQFPTLIALNGLDLDKGAAAALSALDTGCAGGELAGPELLRVEASCRGGCVASTRFGLAMLEAEGKNFRGPALLAIGGGIARGDKRLWFDGAGRAWDEEDIAAFAGPKAAIGSCARRLAPLCDYFAEGCMPLANAPHALLHAISGSSCALLSLRNKRLLSLSRTVLAMRNARAALLRKGERIDLDFPLEQDSGNGAEPPLRPEELTRDWVAWPLPPLTDAREIKALIAREDDLALASFSGQLKPGAAARLTWSAAAFLTAGLSLSPLVVGLISLAAGARASPWFLAFGFVELLHAAELPLALKARHAEKEPAEGPDKAITARSNALSLARTIMLTLVAGFPAWLPYRRGLLPRPKRRRA